MIKINGVTIKTPAEFQVDIVDLDGETHRNAKGELIRDRIAVKRKLGCSWPALTQEETSVILTAIQNVFFTIEYPDPMSGVATKTFYVGDRNMPMLSNRNNTILWEGLKCNFIEK